MDVVTPTSGSRDMQLCYHRGNAAEDGAVPSIFRPSICTMPPEQYAGGALLRGPSDSDGDSAALRVRDVVEGRPGCVRRMRQSPAASSVSDADHHHNQAPAVHLTGDMT